MQTHAERPAAPALARHAACVWVQRVARGSAPYRHRTVPNGSAEIVCRVGGTPVVVGPQTGPVEEILAPGETVIGVRLRPGAVPAVLGLPASELVDLYVDAADLWGRAAADALGEAVADGGSPALEAAVLGRVRQGPPRTRGASVLDPVALAGVDRLMPWRGHDVGSLPTALNVSERQLRRRFQASVGLAPKVLQRMLRFQGFLALAHARPDADLALLAAEAGYADQPHLTHETLRLAGATPRALLRQSERDCLGRHDHSASYGPLLAARGGR